MKSKKLSVIVPVYRGEKFIGKNLEEMKKSISKFFKNYEIICVIDGMKDGSFKEAKKVKGVKVYGYEKNMGKGYALKYGVSHSAGDYVTFIDADMDLHPKQLKNFIPYMATADMVIGSKRHPFSKVKYPLTRKIMSWCFHIYSRIVLGLKLKDTQTGLKLFKREVLEVILPLVVVKRYAFDLELCFLAIKNGFRIVEAPVEIKYRFTGSDINKVTILGMFLDVLGIRYRYSILNFYQKRHHKERFSK